MPRSCFLRCLLDSHAPIELIHNIETIIGRSKITKIKDQACSRQQLSLKADCEKCLVELKPLGVNPSGLNGLALTTNGIYKVEHGSMIEILINSYIHILEFDPPPEGIDKPKAGHKRKLEEDEEEHRKRKSLKINEDPKFPQVAKAVMANLWEEIDSGDLYVFTSKGVKSSSKIAAFDMDGTLIKPKSGKVHPVDTYDWQIAFPTCEKKLKELIEDDYKCVILSNQAPIGNGRVKIADFKKKVEAIIKKLDVPFQVYLATGKGFYRKPGVGMWQVLSNKKNDNIGIDFSNSFYCGDAAGRLPNWAPGKKKDHSMADKLMAENLDLKFYTPEEFFLGHSVKNVPMSKPDFNPKEINSENFNDRLISKEKEILVFVGFPGSGKSFLAKQIEKKSDYKYATVCRDTLGSWQKCAVEAKKLLRQGKSVIVDSTNPDKESRNRWVSLAKEMNVDCRCAKMTASMAHARHNNKFRELMKIQHVPVNDIIYHSFKKKFVEPTASEGFKDIINVNFNPCFDDEEAEKIYRMHLLEK